ncbi:MAG: SagB/ThcOx family dehydrogenase [Deltaproteobacteria bacterium]|jgi:SagB-type dehydrogenase family enzyme|nr:SagB/ThcOx family dehydrogenase [Deltaproteobacteria bacterium]
MTSDKTEDIIHYHEATKHHFERYARSLGYMDWDNQPKPFRTYKGTPVLKLPLLKTDPPASYLGLYERQDHTSQPFVIETIAGFLELSLGLSAWKAAGSSRWSLRINPSSGNLHPTEAHLILPSLDAHPAGIYHYNALGHALERRADLPPELWQGLVSHFGSDGFLIAVTSIFWRESWKYGERAFRYCNHDAGHALACLSFAANLFGWKCVFLNELSDEELEAILGFDQIRFRNLEQEHTDCLCFIFPSGPADAPRGLPAEIVSDLANLTFIGEAEILSQKCIDWEIIYRTARAAKKPSTGKTRIELEHRKWFTDVTSPLSATDIIRKRRSAVGFDDSGFISKGHFLSILDKTLPRRDMAPFDIELTEPLTHLLLFVHNVPDLTPGLYFFLRKNAALDELKAICRPDFQWTPVEKDFPLYLLAGGNYRQQAMMVSCHQEIAGSSAFSLGMIVKFKEILTPEPHRYRHLFWETGMIGQVLYLEAEAHGARGTGIGCFFDDAVHEILGFSDNRYQSLYHFTIGRPIEDPRLATYPPYSHL